MSGYVRIHRSLIGHPAFRNDAEAMAFAWLVAKAAWQPTRVRYKERIISLDRGQVAVSVRDFARAMDRDKAWCERLLKRLKSETMVTTRCETGVNIITISNYKEYQSRGLRSETLDETQPETGARQGQDTEQGREEREEDKGSSNDDSSAEPTERPLTPNEIVEAWNSRMVPQGFPAVRRLTDARRKHLKARLRENTIEDWQQAMAALERSEFCRGNGPNGWIADFDFLLQPKSFTKLLEGAYDH